MRTPLVTLAFSFVALAAASYASTQVLPQWAAARCVFRILEAAPPPVITGPEEITSLVRFVAQPDSPVVVSRVDFSNADLTVGGESFAFNSDFTVELFNVSNRVLRNIDVRLHIRSRHGAAGGGPTLAGPLSPGQRELLRVSRQQAQGTAPMNEVRVMISVDSVEWADCLYRPSQLLPAFSKPLP
jgi:hypothetical protein